MDGSVLVQGYSASLPLHVSWLALIRQATESRKVRRFRRPRLPPHLQWKIKYNSGPAVGHNVGLRWPIASEVHVVKGSRELTKQLIA